jgi:hypothetical protein
LPHSCRRSARGGSARHERHGGRTGWACAAVDSFSTGRAGCSRHSCRPSRSGCPCGSGGSGHSLSASRSSFFTGWANRTRGPHSSRHTLEALRACRPARVPDQLHFVPLTLRADGDDVDRAAYLLYAGPDNPRFGLRSHGKHSEQQRSDRGEHGWRTPAGESAHRSDSFPLSEERRTGCPATRPLPNTPHYRVRASALGVPDGRRLTPAGVERAAACVVDLPGTTAFGCERASEREPRLRSDRTTGRCRRGLCRHARFVRRKRASRNPAVERLELVQRGHVRPGNRGARFRWIGALALGDRRRVHSPSWP